MSRRVNQYDVQSLSFSRPVAVVGESICLLLPSFPAPTSCKVPTIDTCCCLCWLQASNSLLFPSIQKPIRGKIVIESAQLAQLDQNFSKPTNWFPRKYYWSSTSICAQSQSGGGSWPLYLLLDQHNKSNQHKLQVGERWRRVERKLK